ncbi:MAG: serine/threonine-protein kinase [Pirellulaceae bacterium]
MMQPHLAVSGAARQRFAREGRAAAAVIDDCVLPIHAVSQWQDVPYLVMQYSAGMNLQKRLEVEGPLKLSEILRIAMQTARGLAAAHGQGLVHRDVKPSNILLDGSVERALLTDFGLARAVDDASVTRTGLIAGTPQYMSPEQVRGESVDARSDLFSLGATMYAMCTGRSPFRGESTYSVLHRLTHNEPRSIQEINPEIPAWLCGIISKLLSKMPSDRFDSAQQVAELLESCLAHVQEPTTTPLPAPAVELAKGLGSARARSKPIESRGGFHYPPIGKLIAAAAFAFFFVAGAIILLETNNGTIRIESNSEVDIPITIRQGDHVVQHLTVSQQGVTSRLKVGEYVIEVEGDDTRFAIKGNEVEVTRGKTWIATISEVPLGDQAMVHPSTELGSTHDENSQSAPRLSGDRILEDKGTLTIETEGVEVPIRIAQGAVVENLSITRNETTTRNLAGSYNVEFDGSATSRKMASPAMEMQNRLQGTWEVLLFDTGDGQGHGRQTYQVTIRENVLHLQTVVNGKAIGGAPYKLVWPDSNIADEVDCVWEPNNDPQPLPSRIACDGTTLQIAMRTGSVDDRFERPAVIASGEGILYLDCKRAGPPIGQAGAEELPFGVSPIIGQWKTTLYLAGGETEIANGRLLDPDRELAALEETIPREELLAGPWVLEVSTDGSLVLQHATARLPLMSLDIGSIGTDTFDIHLPKHVLESPLAKFSPGLEQLQLRARFQINGNSLKLSISEIDDADATLPLSPTADMYFECERLAAATEVKESSTEAEPVRRLTQPQVATPTDSAPEVAPPEWSDFLKRLPEVGTVLVMFGNDSDISKQMEPVARSVAEAASIKLIELPQFEWRRITAPPATHFVLMKDRQLVGTRTGLLTEKRLAESTRRQTQVELVHQDFAYDGRVLRQLHKEDKSGAIGPLDGHFVTWAGPMQVVGRYILPTSNATASLPKLLVTPEFGESDDAPDRYYVLVSTVQSENFPARMTVWVDPVRGFLPVRIQFENLLNNTLDRLFEVETAEEVSPGIWFPTRGSSTFYHVAAEVLPKGITREMIEAMSASEVER